MKKMGRLFEALSQLCHAHGLHLAVCDVLYKKGGKKKAAAGPANIEQEDESMEEETESESEVTEGSDGEDCSDEEDYLENNPSQDDSATFATETVEVDQGLLDVLAYNLVTKVQKLAKAFRKSTINNDYLQEEVVKLVGKELVMKIDCKTRWHTILFMLKHFDKVKVPLENALISNESLRKLRHLFPDEEEIKSIEDIVKALSKVECASRMLCQRDCSLSKADEVRVEKVTFQKVTCLRIYLSCKNHFDKMISFSQYRSLRL